MFLLSLLSSVSCLGLQYLCELFGHTHTLTKHTSLCILENVRQVRVVVNCMGEYESDGCTPSAACRAIRDKFGVSRAASVVDYQGVRASHGEL